MITKTQQKIIAPQDAHLVIDPVGASGFTDGELNISYFCRRQIILFFWGIQGYATSGRSSF